MPNPVFFKFRLTEKQAEQVKQAERWAQEMWAKGQEGAIFCQIGQGALLPDGVMVVKGAFVPNKQAIEIQSILSDFFKDDI